MKFHASNGGGTQFPVDCNFHVECTSSYHDLNEITHAAKAFQHPMTRSVGTPPYHRTNRGNQYVPASCIQSAARVYTDVTIRYQPFMHVVPLTSGKRQAVLRKDQKSKDGVGEGSEASDTSAYW